MDSKKSPKGRKRSSKGGSGGPGGATGGGASGGSSGGSVSGGSSSLGASSAGAASSGPSSSALMVEDTNYWDCSVCTFRNNAEAFKCSMCDVRKGTSTRKPRLNPDLVAQQQQAQALTPPPPPSVMASYGAPGTSSFSSVSPGASGDEETDLAALASLKANKRLAKDTKPKSEKKPSAAKEPKKVLVNKARLKNVDRSSATYHSVTVSDFTVVITEFKPKAKKDKRDDHTSATSSTSPFTPHTTGAAAKVKNGLGAGPASTAGGPGSILSALSSSTLSGVGDDRGLTSGTSSAASSQSFPLRQHSLTSVPPSATNLAMSSPASSLPSGLPYIGGTSGPYHQDPYHHHHHSFRGPGSIGMPCPPIPTMGPQGFSPGGNLMRSPQSLPPLTQAPQTHMPPGGASGYYGGSPLMGSGGLI